jgi:uncharacterized protein YajQ (UPF0234 family)
MPSFDIVSEVDGHELTNAIDQARRVVDTRFDFKGVEATFEQNEKELTLITEADIQLRQMREILEGALVKRGIDIKVLDWSEPETSGQRMQQKVTVREGLDKEQAKKITKMIKDQKLKVQAAVQGEQVRVTGKKRDDLQSVISFFKQSDFDQPLQYINFRD